MLVKIDIESNHKYIIEDIDDETILVRTGEELELKARLKEVRRFLFCSDTTVLTQHRFSKIQSVKRKNQNQKDERFESKGFRLSKE